MSLNNLLQVASLFYIVKYIPFFYFRKYIIAYKLSIQ